MLKGKGMGLGKGGGVMGGRAVKRTSTTTRVSAHWFMEEARGKTRGSKYRAFSFLFSLDVGEIIL